MNLKDIDAAKIAGLAEKHTDTMVSFFKDIIATGCESAEEGPVIDRVEREMNDIGFDEVKRDGLGNILGRIGSGPRVIAMDAHLDVVGIGDRSAWKRDPYGGEIENGVIYGRGASDQKGGMVGMLGAARIIKELGLAKDYQLWITGTVLEEDCDGLCWMYILKEKVLTPEVVVITEPTNLAVHRGHRGRMELEVRVKGRSCHGAFPERGDNAVYKMAPIIADVERLNDRLKDDAFLGKGTCAISVVRSTSPSLCAVADSCTIHVDRRLTAGEDEALALQQLRDLPSVKAVGAEVVVLDYARESYSGLTYPMKKYYPSWVMPEDSAVVKAGVAAAESALGRQPELSRWGFSTNGTTICGMYEVPCIGFGPGHEIHAHSIDDQCPIEHLTKAAQFYATFPHAWLATNQG